MIFQLTLISMLTIFISVAILLVYMYPAFIFNFK